MSKTIKNFIMLCVMILAVCSNGNAAEYVSAIVVGDLRYFLYDDNTASVSAYKGEPVEVVIPETVTDNGVTYKVTTLGENTFLGCSSLKKISMPSIINIGLSSLKACNALEVVEIPNVEVIDNYAFTDCTSLTHISGPSVKKIGAETFRASGLQSVNLPEAVSVPWWAFYRCKSLVDVNLPKVESIETSAFSYCENLKQIVLPNVTVIGRHGFNPCLALEIVEMPKVEKIGESAFNGENLKKVVVGNVIPRIEVSSFHNKAYTDATVYVPKGTKEQYMQNDLWSKFWDIVEYDASSAGIEDVRVNITNGTKVYYDMMGNKYDSPKSGINIVVDENGNISKQIFK